MAKAWTKTARSCAVMLGLLVSVCPATSGQNTDLKSLYDAHQWFALREAIRSGKLSALYRGAVEVAFNRSRGVQKHLRQVIDRIPRGDVFS